MSIRQDSRTQKWYFRFQYKGRYFGEGGFRTRDQAQFAETRRKDLAIQGRHFPEAQAEGLTLAEGAEWFFENHAKVYKRSWKNDRARINQIVQFFGRKPMKDVSPEDVEDYLRWAVKNGRGRSGGQITDNTRNHYLGMLKTIFNRLKKRRKYFGDNPAMYVETKKVSRARVRFLYPDEEKMLSPAVARDPIVWPYYYVALHTGMRIGEIANLRVEDISIPAGFIFVRNSKNSRSRHVPLSEDLRAFLAERIRGKKPADFALAGVIRDYVSRRFKRICHQVGIKDFMFHDLRHTFTQRLLTKGEPIYKVSKILGHSSVVVTEQHYGHLAWQDIKPTVDKIDGVINMPMALSEVAAGLLTGNRVQVAVELPQAILTGKQK